MIASMLLAATVSAATVSFTATAAGMVEPPKQKPSLPCAKIVKGERIYVYFRVDEGMLKVSEELALAWVPPFGSDCSGSTLTARNLGDKSAYRTWAPNGMDPCGERWAFAFTIRDIATQDVASTVLASGIAPVKP